VFTVLFVPLSTFNVVTDSAELAEDVPDEIDVMMVNE
jgi:hypothetical protein